MLGYAANTIDLESDCFAYDGDFHNDNGAFRNGENEFRHDEQNRDHQACGLFLVHRGGVSTDPGSCFREAGLHGRQDEEPNLR